MTVVNEKADPDQCRRRFVAEDATRPMRLARWGTGISVLRRLQKTDKSVYADFLRCTGVWEICASRS